MLGWELPPQISGGMGRACAGLLRGIREVGGVDVSFVLPSVRGDEILEGTGCELSLHGLWTEQEPHGSAQACPDEVLFPSVVERSARGSYGNNLKPSVLKYTRRCSERFNAANAFDVIHAHDWLTYPAGIDLCRRTTTPLVVHVHSTEFDRSEYLDPAVIKIEREGMDEAHRIITVSEYTKRTVIEHYGQVPRKVEVIPNAPDFRCETSVALAKRPKQVVFVGRITYQKGPEYFVEAAAKILHQLPDTRFVMAGDGDQLALVKSLARSYGIGELIGFPGFLGHKEISELLACSRALIMPSMSEPFGLVALEAIAHGVPAIVSSRSGICEVVRNIVKVDPVDTDSIARSVVRLLKDDKYARELSHGAAEEIREMNWKRSAARLCDVYTSLCANSSIASLV